MNKETREADIEEVKSFIAQVGVAKELLQFQILAGRSKAIREKLERLLPPITTVDEITS